MKYIKLKYLPNLLTFCNMTIGILVVLLMIHNNSLSGIKWACYLIYTAALLDLFDGFLARHLNATTDMGKQLDSFADFVSFGIAPVAIFVSNMYSVPWYMMIILVLYPLAGGFRLARYNLQEDYQYFIGLPITFSGFILTTAMLINSYLHSEFTVQFINFYLLLILALSILMVSNFRVSRILKVKKFVARNKAI